MQICKVFNIKRFHVPQRFHIRCRFPKLPHKGCTLQRFRLARRSQEPQKGSGSQVATLMVPHLHKISRQKFRVRAWKFKAFRQRGHTRVSRFHIKLPETRWTFSDHQTLRFEDARASTWFFVLCFTLLIQRAPFFGAIWLVVSVEVERMLGFSRGLIFFQLRVSSSTCLCFVLSSCWCPDLPFALPFFTCFQTLCLHLRGLSYSRNSVSMSPAVSKPWLKLAPSNGWPRTRGPHMKTDDWQHHLLQL